MNTQDSGSTDVPVSEIAVTEDVPSNDVPSMIPQDVPSVDTPNTATPDASPTCALAANTTPTANVVNGCAVLDRDTSACMGARMAQGLSGAWLKFSCRVTLTNMPMAATPYVVAASDSQPDYQSNYFQPNDPCYSAFMPAGRNPNHIAARSLMVRVPINTNMMATRQGLGPIGIAINGVAIFNNQAAPGDDIFREAETFDRCAAHPAPDSTYHYHSEPYAISHDDSRLIGVLKDGYFIYGRRDMDGSMPTLDANGGHVGMTADSAAPVYHYHVNEQTSTSPGTLGQRQWFLTTGTFRGVPLN